MLLALLSYECADAEAGLLRVAQTRRLFTDALVGAIDQGAVRFGGDLHRCGCVFSRGFADDIGAYHLGSSDCMPRLRRALRAAWVVSGSDHVSWQVLLVQL